MNATRSNAWSQLSYRQRQAIKAALLARDGLTCCLCGLAIPTVKAATIEHRIKRSQGGALTALANLGLAHANCNYSNRYTTTTVVVDGSSFFCPETPRSIPRPMLFPPPDVQKNGR